MPPNIASSQSRPVEIRCDVAVWTSCSDVIGSTAIPLRSIRNGYSLVPWLEPRYLTIRSRRVEIWSSYTVVQRDDAIRYVFFQPLSGQRVDAALARDHGGDAALLEPRKQPAELGAQHGGIAQAREQRFDRVEDDAPGADRLRAWSRRMNSAFQIVLAGLLDFRALDPDVLDRDRLRRMKSLRLYPSDRTLSTRSCSLSSNVTNRPGWPMVAPCVRKARPKKSSRIRDRRRRAWAAFRKAAAGDFIESVYACRDLPEVLQYRELRSPFFSVEP